MTVQTEKKNRRYSWKLLFMDIARLVCVPLLLVYRMKRLTPEGEKYRGKIRGGAIMAANHTSFSDPFLVGVAVWYRRLYFLVAEVVMRGRLRNWLLRGVGAIRIDRNETDIEAIRQSVAVLKQGALLAMFPQGGITDGEAVQTVKSGAVLIALQAGVPIVPMHIYPRKHWYSRRVVVIGDPVDPQKLIGKKFPTTADIDRVSKLLMDEMNRCMAHQ